MTIQMTATNHQTIRLNQQKQPPKEFKVWPFGVIKSTKGNFLFDQNSAKLVQQAYNEHGADIGFDYEHRSLDPHQEEDHRSAGWAKLAIRPDGLYLTNISWTPKASQALSNSEYRYFSPAFDTDPPFDKPLKKGQIRRITRLVNVALTNNPATHGLTALVAASQRGQKKMGDEEVQVVPPSDNEGDEVGEQQEEMDLHGALAQLLDALEQGDMQSAQSMVPSLREMIASDAKRDIAEGDLPQGGISQLASDDALAGDDEEKPDAALCNYSKTGKLSQAIAKFSGLKTEDEQLGYLFQLHERAQSAATLSQKVKEDGKKAHERMVEEAIKQGKLLPSKKTWALSQTSSVLKGYLHGIPAKSQVKQPLVALSNGSQEVQTSHISQDGTFQLSAADRSVIKQFNISEEAYIAQKKLMGAK